MQQAFSSDQILTLHLGIPTLEALYKAWLSRLEKNKYAPFISALQAACATVDKYYEKTTLTDTYILAMGKLCLIFLFRFQMLTFTLACNY